MGAARGGGSRSKRIPGKRGRPGAVSKNTTSSLQPVKESSGKSSRVKYYKGMQVMSDNEGPSLTSKHDMSDSDTSTARKNEIEEESKRLPANY